MTRLRLRHDDSVTTAYRRRGALFKGASAVIAAALTALAAAQAQISFWNQGEAIVAGFTEEAAAAFEAETGHRVETQVYPNEAYKTVVQVAMGAGKQPDVFFNWGGEDAFRFVRIGRIRDVTEAAAQSGLPDALLTPYRLDGRAYGVPLTQHTVVFFYNEDVFARLGLREPRDFAELAAACRAIRTAEPDLIPISLGAKEPWTVTHYLTMLFARFVPPEVRMADDAMTAPASELFTHEGYVQALDAFRALQDADCFNRGINSVRPEEARALFGVEVAAMTFCGTWCLTPLDQDGLAGRYGLFPMPGEPDAAGDQDAAFLVVEGMQIAAATEHPEIAEAFVRHMVSAPVQADFVRRTGRLPVNAEAIAMVETSDAFAEAVSLLTDAPRAVMPLDMTLDNQVVQAVYVGGQEFVNRTKTAEEVVGMIRRAALRAKERRGV